jgi:hypothetical protein
VQRWKLGKRGLIDDRPLDGGRQRRPDLFHSASSRVSHWCSPAYSDDFQTLILSSPACATPLRIDRKAPASGAKVTVTLWDDEFVGARRVGGLPRLVRRKRLACPGVRPRSHCARASTARSTPGTPSAPTADGAIAFPDSAPFLVISRQSLAELERQLPENRKRCADLRRFRPNIVVDGAHGPHEEDKLVQNRHRRQRRRARRAPRRQAVHALPPHHLRSRRRHHGRRRRRAALHAAPLPRAPVTEDGARSLVPVFGLHFLHDWQKGRWQNDWRRRRRCAARDAHARDVLRRPSAPSVARSARIELDIS